MPLIRFDLIKGRTEKEIADLLDAAHEAMLAAFHVPMRDRYQIVQEHEAQNFYRLLCEALQKNCGIVPSDVMVSIVDNTDVDWSFGNGEAQFLTGKLGPSAKT